MPTSNNHTERAAESRPRVWPTALAVIFLLTVVGLFSATAGGGVQHALLSWYTWGTLAWLALLIDRRLPVEREQLGRRVLWHIPLSLLFTAIYVCLLPPLNAAIHGNWPDAQVLETINRVFRMGGVQWNFTIYWLLIGAYLAYDYHQQARTREQRAVRLEALLAEARLSALRAQLNPHFLFNALNTVSAFVESNPKLARRMLEHLGDLLRFSLDSGERQELTLAEELDALDHYLAIQRARFGDRLAVRLDIAANTREALLPGLLLQPLVENAIVHGVSLRAETGEVRISASRVDGTLALAVADNGTGLPAGWRLERDAGIGLTNTRARLSELYGPAHDFEVTAAPGGGVVATIRIPFRDRPRGEQEREGAEAARHHRR
ncbi:histidine kinase [uncultured Paludibaculum sp.]|uniref:sensor histidine kinase n=1 Tax=uncultured Paludibaculum sp. TaxID=1765020 RepID=UPI002AABA819|nr:histidine kinase [uncultured Paludibaculum sp.]